jgi:hypothetical protein
MEKIKKEDGAEIMAFYTGGAKLHAITTHSKEDLEAKIENAMIEKTPFVKLDTVNTDADIADDSLTLLLDKMLFYTVLVKTPKSNIIQSPRDIKVVS